MAEKIVYLQLDGTTTPIPFDLSSITKDIVEDEFKITFQSLKNSAGTRIGWSGLKENQTYTVTGTPKDRTEATTPFNMDVLASILDERVAQRLEPMNRRFDELITAERRGKKLETFSRLSETNWSNTTAAFGLKRGVGNLVFEEVDDREVKPYAWKDTAESDQYDSCIDWLNTNAPLDSAQYADFSTIKNWTIETAERTYTGGTNIVMLPKAVPADPTLSQSEMVAVLELKKPQTLVENMASWMRQTEAELLAASSISQYPVIAILTDLGLVWRIFWLRKTATATYLRIARLDSPEEGVAFLQKFAGAIKFADPSDAEPVYPAEFSFPLASHVTLPSLRTTGSL